MKSNSMGGYSIRNTGGIKTGKTGTQTRTGSNSPRVSTSAPPKAASGGTVTKPS